MLANIDRTFLLYFALTVLVVGVCIVFSVFVASVIFLIKNGNKSKFVYVLISVLCVFIVAASWILNFGWLRFFLTLLMVPVIHAAVFVIINNFSASYVNQSVRLKIYTVLSYVTYVFGYLTFPDGGDYGPMYVFFGLIRNDAVAGLANYASEACFLAHTVLLVLQIGEVIIAKRKIAESKKAN